ncbi:MAG: ATP-dependent DNA helicase [Gaiellales bacterium]
MRRYSDQLGRSSPLRDVLPAFRSRDGQLRLAQEVGDMIDRGGVLVAEAATGIGKSLAYLVPAALSGRRVVVSTATKALQGQLLHEDLPLARQATGVDITAAVVKGRSNYVCRVQRAFAHQRVPEDLQPELARLDEWLIRTREGDRDELPFVPPEAVWRELSVGPDRCRGGRCTERDGCYAELARERATGCQIVLVNHALYLADLALRAARGGEPVILPEHDVLVVDEAHAFEQVAAEALGARVSGPQLARFARDVDSACAAAVKLPPSAELALLQVHGDRLFNALPEGRRVRLDEQRLRLLPRDAADAMRSALDAIAERIKDHSDECEALARQAQRQAYALEAILSPDHEETVVWSERDTRGVELRAAPTAVGPLLREHLWDRLHAGVLVSATLADGDGLSGICRRLGADGARTHIEPSPFDIGANARLYVPTDIVGGGRADPELVADRIGDLVEAAGGRALVLFPSLARLRRVHELLADRLTMPVLCQGTAARGVLLERFREDETSVLFASMTFWQGVDIPGRSLELVVLESLPFAVPDDPLIAAKSERAERDGGSGFRDVQLPHAALLLKQGFGRLLRSETDRGVVAVLDARLVTSGYGAFLRGSLPAVPVTDSVDEVRAFLAA